MRVLAHCFLVVLLANGTTWAQESAKSPLRLVNQSRFSRDTIALIAAKDGRVNWQLNQGTRTASTVSNKKTRWPVVIAGLGMIAGGILFAATSTDTFTITSDDPFPGLAPPANGTFGGTGFLDPFTLPSISADIEQTNNGMLWGGIGLAAGGGVLALLGAIL